MDLSIQRRIAAEILGVGENNIRFNPERIEDISKAFRREEIRALIEDGAIYAIRPSRNSRGRINLLKEKRRKGRRRGHGSRKGSKASRTDPEKAWVYRIRKIRRYLRYLRDAELIDRKTYRILYRRAKGGQFKSLSALRAYLESEGLIKRG